MTIQYQAGPERKQLVAAMTAILGTGSTYTGMPKAAYIVGEYNVSRESTLTGPDNRELVQTLREHDFEPLEETYDSEPEVAAEPEAEETGQPDRLSIEMPLDGFDPAKLDNLRKLVDSKATLLKMTLGVDDLPVEIHEDRAAFPWFPCDGNATAYAQLITALCRTAKEKQRVNARPQKVYQNPKFTMRCWLTTALGLVGDDYRKIRKLMCSPLEGNSAWSTGAAPRKAEKEKAGENNA